MDWRVKASIQKLLSTFRVGDKLNHVGSRLMNPGYMQHKIGYHVNEALIHLNHLEKNGYRLDREDVFFELGTGYAIVESLTFILLGAKKVITVDITEDVKFKESLKYLDLFTEEHIQNIAARSLLEDTEIRDKINSLKTSSSMEEFLGKAGITYIAPYTIEDIKKYAGEVRVCYSQVVLEHIPEPVMRDIFKETRNLLVEGGYHSHIVNLTDHFRNPGIFRDNNVTDVNFLRYSDKYWNSWCGNDIAYVNRLRFPFYTAFFEELGFRILDIEKQKEEDRMNDLLSYDQIHDDIKSKYDKEELMDTLWVQRFHIVCINNQPDIDPSC